MPFSYPQIEAAIRREPFRVFFPLGIFASVAGVALWPLVYAGWLGFYPGEAHARIMVEGFVGAFAVGFLGTAFPKMIESPPLTRFEIAILVLTTLGCAIAHACGETVVGDACFLATWLLVLVSLVVRMKCFGKDLPPPGFVLVGLGILAGIAGTIMLLIEKVSAPSMFQFTLSRLFLYEGFLLGPIIGIGGFLFPRFLHPLECPHHHHQKSWKWRALAGLIVGFLVLGTYITQALGFVMGSPIVRAVIVTGYLFSQVALFRRESSTGSLVTMLRMAILCLLLGILLSGVSVIFQTAVKHLLFIGGYGLLVLTIASRVTWGHSGNIKFTRGKQWSLRWVLSFVILAMATRVVADFIPAIRVSHHIYAALCWIIAAGIWSWAVLRYVRTLDPEEG